MSYHYVHITETNNKQINIINKPIKQLHTMKQNLFSKLWLRVGMIVAIMTTALAGTAWAQAPVNTTLWEETWTGGEAGETPSVYGFEGTTVYGGATLTYTQSSDNTKLYAEVLAGGTSPELLLSKSNQTWTISNIPTGQATEMSLTFLSNKTTFAVTSSTTGITISGSQKSWTITATSNVTTFDLTIKNTGSQNARIDNVSLVVKTAGGGTPLNTSDLAITGAPVALEFDLYNNSDAQTVRYTTTSAGAVTVSESDYVSCVVDETAKTITVTPTAVTPSVQTITVYQAADDTYAAGSKSFTVKVTDSTPFDGVIFDATVDKGTSDSNGSPDEMTKGVVHIYGTDAAFATTEYRMYKNSTTTISTTDGSLITKIEFTNASSNPATGFGNQTGWTTSSIGGIWEGEAESVSFVASGAQVRATLIKVTVVANTNPSINADNKNIACDATDGSITYTINNPVAGGVLTAATNDSWLTLGTVGETIPFTCSANATATERTATVTLTYTYNTNETVTKSVTVTQAGDPNVVDNISDITEVGTAYKVRGTVVATNSKGFVIGDGTGYVYYYKGAAVTQSVGDKVTISGTTGTYGQIIQFTNSATVAEATTSNYNNTPAATVITEVPDYSTGYHLSTYLEFEGDLTKNSSSYFINLGEEQVQISYPTDAQGTALTALDGKTVLVKGYFSGINSNSKFTVMLESVVEVEVQHEQYSLTVSDLSNVDLFVFDAADQNQSLQEGEGTVQILDGTEVLISVDVAEGFVLQSLMVDGNDVTSQIDETGAYTFNMPKHNVTVTATAVEYVAPTGGTIVFGNSGTKINAANVTGVDNAGNTWTITTEGTTSFTPNSDYSQVGSGSKPATSITFTTTLPAEATITSFEAKFGGFNGTAGTVTLKVGDTTVGTGSLSGTTDVTVTNTSTETGTVLTVTVTDIDKGVKCYYISYEVETEEPIKVKLNASGYATFASTQVLDFSETDGYTAWQITGVSGGAITFSQISEAVAAETGVLLKGEPNDEITLTTAESGSDISSTNKLQGFVTETPVQDNEYYGLNGAKFVKVTSGTVPAGRALLPVSVVTGNVGVKALTFNFEDDATAIENLNVNDNLNDGAIYNVAGQRLNKMQKGINIVNGKKILK